jgi:hypothetical protein
MDFPLFMDVFETGSDLPCCIEGDTKVIKRTMSVDRKTMSTGADEGMIPQVIVRGTNLPPEHRAVAILTKVDIVADGTSQSWGNRDIRPRTTKLALAGNFCHYEMTESRDRRRSSWHRGFRGGFWERGHKVQVILDVLFQIQVAELHIEVIMRTSGEPSLVKDTDQVGMSPIA